MCLVTFVVSFTRIFRLLSAYFGLPSLERMSWLMCAPSTECLAFFLLSFFFKKNTMKLVMTLLKRRIYISYFFDVVICIYSSVCLFSAFAESCASMLCCIPVTESAHSEFGMIKNKAVCIVLVRWLVFIKKYEKPKKGSGKKFHYQLVFMFFPTHENFIEANSKEFVIPCLHYRHLNHTAWKKMIHTQYKFQ